MEKTDQRYLRTVMCSIICRCSAPAVSWKSTMLIVWVMMVDRY